MTITVWPVDAIAGVPSYTGRMLREAQSVFMAGATPTRPLGARSGVRPGTSTSVVGATSLMWWMDTHAGILDVEAAAEAGPYAYALNASESGAVTAADATRPRIDIVWVRLDDPAESDGSSVPTVVAGYTAGAPLAIPVAPATPARCMVLATLQVPMSGGGSPTVIWAAPYCVAAGGVLPVPAGVRPANPYVGQYIDDATLGLLRWNGTSWVAPLTPAVTTRYTTATSAFSTPAYVAFIAPAVTGDGIKRFRITVTAWHMTGAYQDVFDWTINDQTLGTVVATHRVPILSGGVSSGVTFVATDVPAAGSHVYNCSAIRASGTGGTGTIQATATAPREITVEQIA